MNTYPSTTTDSIQEIKARISIADLARRYLDLHTAGNRLVAPCPFHQETKPSFSVNEEQGTFYCFGCQASGDIFDFYARINGLNFKEALEALAEEAGVRLSSNKSNSGKKQPKTDKTQMFKMNEIAATHYRNSLKNTPLVGAYTQERGIANTVLDSFSIGFSSGEWHDLVNIFKRSGLDLKLAKECGLLLEKNGNYYDRFRNRLMFPIRDVSGRTIAFGGRSIPGLEENDAAKYINTNVTPIYKKSQQLFGLDMARRAISAKKNIMITEGYMDVLTLHQFGYAESVAVLGTSFPDEQVKRICELSKQVELLFDGDNPGRSAAFKACEKLLAKGVACKVILFPHGEDIDSLLKSQGRNAFESLRVNAVEGLNYCIQYLKDSSPHESVEWARKFLSELEIPELFQSVASRISSGLNLDEAQLRSKAISRIKNQSFSKSEKNSFSNDRYLGKDGAFSKIDEEILSFIVRYPHCLEHVQNIGVDVCLKSNKAVTFWEKLCQHIKGDILLYLTEEEKIFWIRYRSIGAPLNNEKKEMEALKSLVDREKKKRYNASINEVLSSKDNQTQREYLQILMLSQGGVSE